MKRFLVTTFILSFSLLLMAGCDTDNNTGKSGYEIFPETIEFIRTQGELEIERNLISGMAVAFVDLNSGFTWTQGFGYADTIQGIPVTEDTMFNIASISKSFTAVAVMQLVEEGLIDLDEPIVTYLPEFSILPHPEYGGDYQNITIRMLLNHTSGIPGDYFGFENLEIELPEWGSISDLVLLITYLETYYKDIALSDSLNQHNPNYMNNLLMNISALTMDFEEGTATSYSNLGYTILGILIASVSNHNDYFYGFVDYMNDHILTPAVMQQSTFIMNEKFESSMAKPYLDILSGQEEVLFVNVPSTGGMFSTAEDMARFMHIILKGGGDLLEGESLNRMIDWGLGFYRWPGAIEMIGHAGGWQHKSQMFLNMEYGIGVFVATNSSIIPSPNVFMERIFRNAIRERQSIE